MPLQRTFCIRKGGIVLPICTPANSYSQAFRPPVPGDNPTCQHAYSSHRWASSQPCWGPALPTSLSQVVTTHHHSQSGWGSTTPTSMPAAVTSWPLSQLCQRPSLPTSVDTVVTTSHCIQLGWAQSHIPEYTHSSHSPVTTGRHASLHRRHSRST